MTLEAPHREIGDYDLGRFALSYARNGERRTLALADVPRIACVRGEDEFFARIDADNWGRSVVVDAYNDMQAAVAREVKEGRRDQALQRLRKFKEEAATMNAHVNSAPVAEQLREADRLEAEVSQAFEGADQAGKQNALSKAANAQAVDARRAGAKR